MAIDLSRVKDRLRDRICPNCARFTRERTCSLPPDRECAIFKYLEEIATIVQRTHDTAIDPYVDNVRDRICKSCLEDDHGCCPMRNAIDCALDCYLPMIVDEVEFELDLQRKDKANHLRSFEP